MPEDRKTQPGPAQDPLNMPDLMDLWKKIYFTTEESWSNTAREFVASETFVEMLHQVKDQYLSLHKVSTRYLDKYFESNPVPSKKDIARVAELVIALEDKIDALDFQFTNNLDSIARSFMKMVDIQQGLHQAFLDLKQEVQLLHQQPGMAAQPGNSSMPGPAPRKPRSKKTQPSETD